MSIGIKMLTKLKMQIMVTVLCLSVLAVTWFLLGEVTVLLIISTLCVLSLGVVSLLPTKNSCTRGKNE